MSSNGSATLAKDSKTVQKQPKYDFVQMLAQIPNDDLRIDVRLMRSVDNGEFFIDIRKARPASNRNGTDYYIYNLGIMIPVNDIGVIADTFNVVADAVKNLA